MTARSFMDGAAMLGSIPLPFTFGTQRGCSVSAANFPVILNINQRHEQRPGPAAGPGS
jgi:hypothetical protein